MDVWLWRARFFKTWSLAAKCVEKGQVRLTRAGKETRLDKPARPVTAGDQLVFAVGGGYSPWEWPRSVSAGAPPAKALDLYWPLENSSPPE